MTRPLALRESQVRAIIRAARKEGARVEFVIGGAVVKLLPDEETIQIEKPVDDKGKGYL
jgi:hypothetical protein